MQVRILILGDVMLDRYIVGTVSRISPEAPVPVVRVHREEISLGGAGNVALNAAKLQAKTSLFGPIGADENGRALHNLVLEHGIEPHLFQAEIPTIAKIRVIGNHQQIVRYDYEEVKSSTAWLSHLQALLSETTYRHVIISDYGKGLCSEALCQYLIQTVTAQGGMVIVDPKGLSWAKYQGAFMITPNLKELSEVWGSPLANEDDADIAQAGAEIRQRFQVQHLLVTRSERGMSLISANEVIHFPTQAQSVYDVTGAGDTVIATLMVSLAMGYSLQDAVRRANFAAGIAVSKFGTYAITKDDLKPWDIENKPSEP